MACAVAALGLLDPRDVRLVGEGARHAFFVVPDHDQDVLYAGIPAGIQYVGQHRPAANLMQDLRQIRHHPRAFSRGQNNRFGGSHGHLSVAGQSPGRTRLFAAGAMPSEARRARKDLTTRPGLEPGTPGPKPGVLPITPPGKGPHRRNARTEKELRRWTPHSCAMTRCPVRLHSPGDRPGADRSLFLPQSLQRRAA